MDCLQARSSDDDGMVQARFPGKLKAWRQSQGLTQKQVAKMIGVTQPAVAFWERGVSFPRKCRHPHIEEVTGVSFEELKRPFFEKTMRMIESSQTALALSPKDIDGIASSEAIEALSVFSTHEKNWSCLLASLDGFFADGIPENKRLTCVRQVAKRLAFWGFDYGAGINRKNSCQILRKYYDSMGLHEAWCQCESCGSTRSCMINSR